MDHIIEILQQTAGQDKLLRILQYLLRFVINSNCTSSKILLLEHHLTLTRKFTRTTRDLFYLKKGLSALNNPDRVEAVGRAVAGFGKCVWLLSDHIELLYRIGVYKSHSGETPAAKWSRISNFLWLIGYIGSVGLYYRQLYIINGKIDDYKTKLIRTGTVQQDSYEAELQCYADELDQLKSERSKIMLLLSQDLVDCGIPAGGLGIISPSLGAFAGICSSLIGLYDISNNC